MRVGMLRSKMAGNDDYKYLVCRGYESIAYADVDVTEAELLSEGLQQEVHRVSD